MALRVAVYGLKHGHINSVIQTCRRLPNVELVAVAEDDPEYRAKGSAALGIDVLDTTGEKLIEHESFDIFAIGDAYGRRGKLIEMALEKGCHLMGDKPLCTRLDECDRIAALLAEKDLAASLMLTFRYNPAMVALQKRLADGVVGELRTLHAFGPHPLNHGVRPDWYWDPRLHGGIINDLQCHGVDLMRWFSGREMTQVLSAAVSNLAAPMVPEFEDNGQHLCLFEDGVKFGGEVSYLQPIPAKSIGWMVLGWCERGQFKIDTATRETVLDIAGAGQQVIEPEPLPRPSPIEDLIHHLETGEARILTTDDVIRSSRTSLEIQEAAVRI